MVKTLFFCESARQAGAFLADGALRARVTASVAANPEAAWRLEAAGFPFLALDVFDKLDLKKDMGPLLAEQVAWAGWADRRLQEEAPMFKRADFRPVRASLYFIKNIWDTIIHRAIVLEEIFGRERPAEVFYFRNAGPLSFSLDTRDLVSGSVFSELLPAAAGRFGARAEGLGPLRGDDWWRRREEGYDAVRRLAMNRLPTAVFRWIQRFRLAWKDRSLPGDGEASDLRGRLIISPEYDLNAEVLRRIEGKGVGVALLRQAMDRCPGRADDAEEARRIMPSVWESLRAEGEFLRPMRRVPWATAGPLEDFFRFYFLDALPGIWADFRAARGLLSRERPRAVAQGVVGDVRRLAFIMAAREEGVPVVFHQHGGAMGDLDNLAWDVSDRFLADRILVYGRGQEEDLSARTAADGLAPLIEVVGSARMDGLRRSREQGLAEELRRRFSKDRAPLVLYVPGFFTGNFFRLTWGAYRDIRVFEMRKKIARLFRDVPRARLLYKAFSSAGADPTCDMLERECPAALVVRDVRLTDLQWAADALLYEAPSTGLWEGLLTDKPVVLFSDPEAWSLRSRAAGLLSGRAAVARTQEEFLKETERLLQDGRFPPVPRPDNGFLKAFVTHQDDGCSAERAADCLAAVGGGRE